MPRRFAPRNDSPDPLSFREGPTGRGGNPSFLRWTGDGPPRSSAPTEGLSKSQQRADVGIGPYGKPNQPPKPAGAQRSVRARGREEWAGIDARTTPKGGPPPRLPRQRLAKRKARKEPLVKCGLCPTTSEFSTAQKVRKSDGSPARALVGAASIEQNSLAPRPAPVTAQRPAFFLLTAPPPFSFCRRKKKMGVESHRSLSIPPVGRPAHA